MLTIIYQEYMIVYSYVHTWRLYDIDNNLIIYMHAIIDTVVIN